MLSHSEVEKLVFTKLLELKGKEYVFVNKEYFYASWGYHKNTCDFTVLVARDNDTNCLFDSKNNLHIDEAKKAKEQFDFEINLETGECKYIQ